MTDVTVTGDNEVTVEVGSGVVSSVSNFDTTGLQDGELVRYDAAAGQLERLDLSAAAEDDLVGLTAAGIPKIVGKDTYSLRIPAALEVRYVSKQGSDTDDGRSWGSAYLTVAAALTDVGTDPALIHVGPGTFSEAGLAIDTQQWINGAGMNATTIQLPAATTNDVMRTVNFASLTGGNTTGGPHSWALTNLSIDGNKANNGGAGGAGLKIYGYGFLLDNIRIRNCIGLGLYSEWSDAVTGGTSPDGMEAFVGMIKVHDCDGGGVDWRGPHDSQWKTGLVYKNTGRGINVQDAASGTLFSQVHSWGDTHTYPWRLASSGIELANCIGAAGGASTDAQVLILANNCRVDGGYYFAGSSTKAGVRGIVLGEAGTSVAACYVDTRVNHCGAGAIDFANDAGNEARIRAFQNSGTVVAGTPASTSTLELSTGAGVGTAELRPAGRLRAPDGSEALPPVSFRNHTGNGLWPSGAGSVAVVVGGTRRLVVNSSNELLLGGSGDVKLYRQNAGPTVVTDSPLKPGRTTTAARPSASTVGAGAAMFDTDLGIPIYSDGANWRKFSDDTTA